MTAVLLCVLCYDPVNDDEPWQTDIAGNASHLRCLDASQTENEEADRG